MNKYNVFGIILFVGILLFLLVSYLIVEYKEKEEVYKPKETISVDTQFFGYGNALAYDTLLSFCNYNTAIGFHASTLTNSGQYNVAIGYQAIGKSKRYYKLYYPIESK